MPPKGRCDAHPGAAARYRCDGCERRLCAECVEEGHRLLFCRHCGERALPLTADAPATTPEVQRAARRQAAYSLADALAYPFRGDGSYLFWGYVALLALFALLGAVPGLGCGVLLLRLLILLLLPGLLFGVIRGTAEGDNEMPDWPDFTDTGERLGEWFAVVVASFLSLLPLALLLRLAGCRFLALVGEGWGGPCWLALVAGSLLGVALWVPAVGAVGTRGETWLAVRLDLHFRALLALGSEVWRTVGLVTLLLLASQLLQLVLAFLPLAGHVLATAAGVYSLFTGAHLVGLLFRRQADRLAPIYG